MIALSPQLPSSLQPQSVVIDQLAIAFIVIITIPTIIAAIIAIVATTTIAADFECLKLCFGFRLGIFKHFAKNENLKQISQLLKRN